jgi:hypothetical protein
MKKEKEIRAAQLSRQLSQVAKKTPCVCEKKNHVQKKRRNLGQKKREFLLMSCLTQLMSRFTLHMS